MAISKPTASSAMADGTPGLPFIQRGLIRELAPGKTEAVGVSGEVERPGVTQGVHHLWQSIGAKVD